MQASQAGEPHSEAASAHSATAQQRDSLQESPIIKTPPAAPQDLSLGKSTRGVPRQDTLPSLDSRRAFHPVPQRPPDQQLLNEKEPWEPKNVLSLDGGGIRGYYSLLFLRYLMQTIKAQEERFTDGTGVEAPAHSSFSPYPQPLHVSHSTITIDSNQQVILNDFLPCHYFDYICGTSTGGLIAIMLSRLRMTVDDTIDEYLNLGGKVFGNSRHAHQLVRPLFWLNRSKYDAKILEDVIQDVTVRRGRRDGSTDFATDAGLCRTFVFAFKKIIDDKKDAVSIEQPYIFRSYDHWERHQQANKDHIFLRNPGPASPYKIWQVARATTAAPFYFDPLEIACDGQPITKTNTFGSSIRRASTFGLGKKTNPPTKHKPRDTFIDGGFGETNNPAKEAYHEIISSNHAIGTFVSIGTGRRTTDRFKSGFANKIGAAVDALGDPETAHIQVLEKSHEEGNVFSYFRFNQPNALPDTDFDEWEPRSNGHKTLQKMDTAFQKWALEGPVQSAFQQCARELVRRRRLRAAELSRWERYALGSCFDCKEARCKEPSDKRWFSRAEFEEHLLANHDVPAELTGQIADKSRTIWAYKAPAR